MCFLFVFVFVFFFLGGGGGEGGWTFTTVMNRIETNVIFHVYSK